MLNFKSLLKYVWPFFAGAMFLLWLKQCNKDPEIVEVPIEIEVEIPVIEKVFDTIVITKDKIIKVTEADPELLKKYTKLKDSVAKESMFKEAIKIREYNQDFSDEHQAVDVYSKVRGTLLEQSVKYKTEPKTIIVKDTVKIPVKNKFYISTELGIPIAPRPNVGPVLKGGLVFQNKRGNTFSLSYDTEGRVWAGKTFKIFR